MTGPEGGPPRFSEAQLRDALHAATGPGPLDPGALIGRARTVRARRRGGVLAAGLVAAVIAVSVGVVGAGNDGRDLTASNQLERGDGAGNSSEDEDNDGGGTAGEMPYAPPAPGTTSTGNPNDTQLSPAPGDVTPKDKYADRPPITGSPCPAQRLDPLTPPTGPGTDGPLLTFEPARAWACVYLADGSAVATELGAVNTTAAVSLLGTGDPARDDAACTSEFGPALRLLVTGVGGQTATIDAESYGCGLVTNGTSSRQSKAQIVALLAQLDDSLRPLG